MQERKKKHIKAGVTFFQMMKCHSCIGQESPRDGIGSCSQDARFEVRSSRVCKCSR